MPLPPLSEQHHMYTKDNKIPKEKKKNRNTVILGTATSRKSHSTILTSASSVFSLTYFTLPQNGITLYPVFCNLLFTLNQAWPYPHVLKYSTASFQHGSICLCPNLLSSSELDAAIWQKLSFDTQTRKSRHSGIWKCGDPFIAWQVAGINMPFL